MNALSSTELAEMGLTMLPKSKQGVEYQAKKQAWAYIEVPGQARGGKLKKYLVSGLPATIQAAIKQKQADALLAAAKPTPLPSIARQAKAPARRKLEQLGLPLNEYADGLTDKQRDCAHARMAIVAEVLKMHEIGGLKITEAITYVVRQIETGALPEPLAGFVTVANARANKQRGISLRTMKEWVSLYRAAGSPNERLAALAPAKTKQSRKLEDIEWLPEWLGVWCNPNKWPLPMAYKNFAAAYIDKYGIDNCPSISQVEYVHSSLPLAIKERGRTTGSAYKAIMPYTARDWLMFNPNDIWVGDGHGFKAKVAHPDHGQPFQPEVTVIIDAATRYAVGWSVSLSESTIAHADALRHGMTYHDAPLMYYTDNGAGPTGKMLDADITGILPRYGIEHATGLPGNPQGRGIIERFWETVTIPLAKTYETYIGNDADSSTKTLTIRKLNSAMNAEKKGKELSTDQQKYRRKLPSWKQFLADLDAAIKDYNANHRHSKLEQQTNGEYATPAAYRAYRLAELGITEQPLTAIELDYMFRPEKECKVHRGTVRLHNHTYAASVLTMYHGDTVRVGYDLHNAEEVIIKKMDGTLIGKAKLDGHVKPAMPVSRIEQLREQRVRNAVKRHQAKIDVAKAELNPTIAHQPDFGSLMYGNGAVIDADYQVIETKPAVKTKKYTMFESELNNN
ncbi:Mu transposase C-terminal domain-containing protein [Neisseria sp. S1]|uniref:Mu transposase C-terminal domain-containing protein n=1 Tax=Neisseria sp. S1 TaxID=3318354 RepID=UPI003A86538B